MGISVRNLNVKGGVVVGPPVSPIQVPVGGFQSGDFDFEIVDTPNAGDTNTVTFTKSGTICIIGDVVTPGDESFTGQGYFNGNIANVRWYTTEADAVFYKQTETAGAGTGGGNLVPYFVTGQRRFAVIDVNTNDTLKLRVFAGDSNPTLYYSVLITFKNSTFNGTTIDTFSRVNAPQCYLTTATVIHKGLSDNGPELTAMRLLREHYKDDPYYYALMVEYYQNSPLIIEGINDSVNPPSEYEFIYQSILKVKNFVDQELWEDAGNEYMNTYIILKNKYI